MRYRYRGEVLYPIPLHSLGDIKGSSTTACRNKGLEVLSILWGSRGSLGRRHPIGGSYDHTHHGVQSSETSASANLDSGCSG